jgi:hypothetical protein
LYKYGHHKMHSKNIIISQTVILLIVKKHKYLQIYNWIEFLGYLFYEFQP